MPYGSKLHILPTNYHLLGAQQDCQTVHLWGGEMENILKKKNQENEPLAEKRTRQKEQQD